MIIIIIVIVVTFIMKYIHHAQHSTYKWPK